MTLHLNKRERLKQDAKKGQGLCIVSEISISIALSHLTYITYAVLYAYSEDSHLAYQKCFL